MFTFSAFVVTEIFRSLCCILQSLRIAECAIYKHVHNSNMLVYCCCVMFANKPYAYFILHYVLCIIYVTNYISHFQDDCTYCNMDCMRYLQMQYTLGIYIMHFVRLLHQLQSAGFRLKSKPPPQTLPTYCPHFSSQCVADVQNAVFLQ